MPRTGTVMHNLPARFVRGRPSLLAGGALLAGTALAAAPAGGQPSDRPRVTVLSGRPDMVTGGDALVRVRVPAGADARRVRVTAGGADVTAAFRREGDTPNLIGLIRNLPLGATTLRAGLGEREPGAEVTLVNYPASGPVFAGPHEAPFFCETQDFKLPSGQPLGPALDADCAVRTRVDYAYRPAAGGDLKALPDPSRRPADVAQATTLDGRTVPYIVRLETGTANRAIYQFAVLDDPAIRRADDVLVHPTGWNGRLIYTFGGGCPGGLYRQGATTGGVDDDVMLRQGYAVASASLNVFGNNCNDLLAAETMMMVKERFVETFGPPRFTIGWGCSGGSYQVHQIADNYPGLLDGIVAGCSFPDVVHAAVSVHSFGAKLLYHYFAETAAEPWTQAQQVAASGMPDFTSLRVLGTRPDRMDPTAVCPPMLPAGRRYDAASNPRGVRCSIYDHAVNVFGRDPATGFARRLLDNVGVQYGLQTLNAGVITKAQFLDLNEKVGGLDIDARFVPARTVGDSGAIRVAYATGRILSGGGGLAATPVIDYRGYSDFANGDPHQRFHSFSTRARLVQANGRADNHVMLTEDGAAHGLFSTASPAVREALGQMDRWLAALAADTRAVDTRAVDTRAVDTLGDAPAARVARARPADLVDACFDERGTKIVERQTPERAGVCGTRFPTHASPYLVAGMPLANNVVKCRRKPVAPADYAVRFTPAELARLRRIFPGGVCDYTKRGVGQVPLAGTWLSFGPSPTHRVAPPGGALGTPR